jgi:ATP synthase protein I
MKDDQLQEKLEESVKTRSRRIKKAEQERQTVLAYTSYLGILGLVFVLPIIGGAYIGRWFDCMVEGYSIRWTLSLIVLGIIVGGMNVYFLFRTRQ